MTVPDELMAALNAEQRLTEIADERARLMAVATRAGVEIAAAPRPGHHSDRTGEGAASLADLVAQLDEQSARFGEHVARAAARIAMMPPGRHREILHRRYVQGQSWRVIAEEMQYYHVENVFRAHREALRKYREMTVK